MLSFNITVFKLRKTRLALLKAFLIVSFINVFLKAVLKVRKNLILVMWVM